MPAKNTKIIDTDVLIVGGGAAGCTLAVLLALSDIEVVCVDQEAPATSLSPTFDGRTTAISYGSRNVFQAAGLWDRLFPHACPIEKILISDNGPPALLEFNAQEVDTDAFGWVVENRVLRRALFEHLDTLKTATHLAPARVTQLFEKEGAIQARLEDGTDIRARLIVGADGKKSFVRDWIGIDTRGWAYGQVAIVCVVTHENPHKNIAVEDFRTEGPFAILPMKEDERGRHRSAVVWTDHGTKEQSPLSWEENIFKAALAERFPAFYGTVDLAGPRFAYPLALAHAQRYIGPRAALIADAAHAIHPIAGQGLNMGLRDVAALAEILKNAKNQNVDLGAPSLLETYQSARLSDTIAMVAATDSLNKLFSTPAFALRALRKTGLRFVQNSSIAKKFFMKQAMGLSGHLPTLVRTGRLS